MKEEWLLDGAAVPVTCETVTELVNEIKRLIDVVGGMALAGQEEPAQRPWLGLTDEEFQGIYDHGRTPAGMMEMVEAKLREKNT